MRRHQQPHDYEPVTPPQSARAPIGVESRAAVSAADRPAPRVDASREDALSAAAPPSAAAAVPVPLQKRGHLFTFMGLFFFTVVLYFRPYEMFQSLSSLTSIAYWLGLLTIAIFIPTQLALEGNLTSRPREVNLVLLLCLAALLSMPLAINPGDAWDAFTEPFIKVVAVFIVTVNAVRTERRLKALILLSLAVGCVVAVGALNDYRLGNLTVDGYRVQGLIGNLFDNPNMMALHLLTMIPIAIALSFVTHNFFGKILYAACAVAMSAGILVSYSRGGFLGFLVSFSFLMWHLGRRHRMAMAVLTLVIVVALAAFAPGNYLLRLASIFDNSLDLTGSATQREGLFWRSVLVALRHPLLGIGIGNFYIMGSHGLGTHNAYTQVAAEMGLPAAVIYIMFIVVPFKSLGRITRETFTTRRESRFYYLALGLRASLVGYMISSFFAHIAYQWYIYYLVGYAVCLRRIYEAEGSSTRGLQPDMVTNKQETKWEVEHAATTSTG